MGNYGNKDNENDYGDALMVRGMNLISTENKLEVDITEEVSGIDLQTTSGSALQFSHKWYLDSGASVHLTNEKSYFEEPLESTSKNFLLKGLMDR